MRGCARESDPYDSVAIYWKRKSEGMQDICHVRRRGMLTYFLRQARMAGGRSVLELSVRSSATKLVARYFETSEPILMPIGTNGSPGNGIKRSTLDQDHTRLK